MHNKETELVCILDKSGSMAGLENDTIGGFNSLLKKQKEGKGVARVTTVLFDHRYQMLHDRLPIQEVQPLTEKDYRAEGTTALLSLRWGMNQIRCCSVVSDKWKEKIEKDFKTRNKNQG